MTKSLHDQAIEAAELTYCHAVAKRVEASTKYYGAKETQTDHVRKQIMQDGINQAIRAYLAFLAEHGWKLVPREATEEMMRGTWVNHSEDAGLDWAEMFDAAPSPEAVDWEIPVTTGTDSSRIIF